MAEISDLGVKLPPINVIYVDILKILKSEVFHILKAPKHRKDSPRLLRTLPSGQVLENRRKAGSMTASCHTRIERLLPTLRRKLLQRSYSGDRVVPLQNRSQFIISIIRKKIASFVQTNENVYFVSTIVLLEILSPSSHCKSTFIMKNI